MILSLDGVRRHIKSVITDLYEQGAETRGLLDGLLATPDSYDALFAFARKLATVPMRKDWPHVEPNDWPAIRAQLDPARITGPLPGLDLRDAAARVESAFLTSVCGCVLGKPIEVDPTLEQLKTAFGKVGEWPLRDYVTEAMLKELGRRHGSWVDTCRENIQYAASDDDLNYTTIGMLVLESKGIHFRHEDLRDLWMHNLPSGWTFGPERTTHARAALASMGWIADSPSEWAALLTPANDVHCGAMIRADAYGYACPGRPELAAELAARDAAFTHRRTGIYGTMFAAAAISCAFVIRDPLKVFEAALQYVPQKSRFYAIVSDALDCVASAGDFDEAYARFHGKYGQYTHCKVFQESATLINTLRFATDCGDGICKQVMQGNDTDSYGCTAGSILGAFFGPGHLEQRWLAPFNNTIHVALADFHEQNLTSLAKRMSRLPSLIAKQLT